MELSQFFSENPQVALAFSGGCDSAYLLWAAVNSGAKVQPYYVKTAFQPEFEFQDARRLADQLNVSLAVIELPVLEYPKTAENPKDRCYYCKKAMFSALLDRVKADGFTVLIDGTNASDDGNDRPGMRALAELSVRSPLRECGVTKEQVRARSKEAGLFTWNKPAYACLATRIPTGVRITKEALRRVETAEDALFRLGFTDFRVRLLGDAARLQLSKEQIGEGFSRREEIRKTLAPVFSTVLLDLEERKGNG